MKFSIQYLSFFVIQTESAETTSAKSYKHYQTMTHEEYQDSELKSFLDSEFGRIAKRKADVHPTAEQVPTKIGRFIVEPGHDLTSNPNYNLFQRLRGADGKEQFHHFADDVLRIYMDTNSVRGGAFILALAKVNELFDEPFLFLLKCDFESKIARIADERSLISKVEMAINARNIKSIQYPHMPEEGMLEEWELKIHQASHARYFEDFLKFVSYEKSRPEIVNDHVMEMVQEYMEAKWQQPLPTDNDPEDKTLPEGLLQEKQQFDVWAASEKRELQEKWDHEQVVEAAYRIVEAQPELELKLRLGEFVIKGPIAEYGQSLHIARYNGKYMLLIEGDSFTFDKGVSPIELLHPEELGDVLRRIDDNASRLNEEA
jgi:hypothetical protein